MKKRQILVVKLEDKKHFSAETEGVLTSTEKGEQALNNKMAAQLLSGLIRRNLDEVCHSEDHEDKKGDETESRELWKDGLQ